MRQLPNLLPIAGKTDHALWFRKFAIYYGVSKNNNKRMSYYLGRLYGVSKSQTFITVAYILYRKFITGITISFHAIFSLLKLILGIQKKGWFLVSYSYRMRANVPLRKTLDSQFVFALITYTKTLASWGTPLYVPSQHALGLLVCQIRSPQRL